MRKWQIGTGALSASLAIGLAGVALVACGDDGDKQSGVAQAKPSTTQEAPDAGTAKRLETYLKSNAKQLPRGHAKDGMVISFVEVSNGELKVWTMLNSDIQGEEAKAAKVCRVAKESGVPEAKGAVVVDGGGVELQRC
jgi:hypothetical protein